MNPEIKQILKNQYAIMRGMSCRGDLEEKTLSRFVDCLSDTVQLLNPPSDKEAKALNKERDELMGNEYCSTCNHLETEHTECACYFVNEYHETCPCRKFVRKDALTELEETGGKS